MRPLRRELLAFWSMAGSLEEEGPHLSGSRRGGSPMVSGSAGTPIPARLLAASFLQPEYLVPLLERWRLIERLEHAQRGRLIQIEAPTGCGKTTLLYQWRNHLSKQGVLAAWLDVFRPDLDAADFVASVGWAVNTVG